MKGSEKFEVKRSEKIDVKSIVNKQNTCETDPISLYFAYYRKKFFKGNGCTLKTVSLCQTSSANIIPHLLVDENIWIMRFFSRNSWLDKVYEQLNSQNQESRKYVFLEILYIIQHIHRALGVNMYFCLNCYFLVLLLLNCMNLFNCVSLIINCFF